jgi:hypothetical protein
MFLSGKTKHSSHFLKVFCDSSELKNHFLIFTGHLLKHSNDL